MVKVVDYGSLPPSRPLTATTRRNTAASFMAVAAIAVSTLAVVMYLNQANQATVLYDGFGSPLLMTDDNVKGIWENGDEAWKDINTVLPTLGGAWEDQNDPTIGHVWDNPGSVTAENGWTGYYDTTLKDGTERDVLPDYVNDVMGWDPTLSGTNQFWGDRAGGTVDDPAPYNYGPALSVMGMSDGDYVPMSYVYGGPSHSSVADPFDDGSTEGADGGADGAGGR